MYHSQSQTNSQSPLPGHAIFLVAMPTFVTAYQTMLPWHHRAMLDPAQVKLRQGTVRWWTSMISVVRDFSISKSTERVVIVVQILPLFVFNFENCWSGSCFFCLSCSERKSHCLLTMFFSFCCFFFFRGGGGVTFVSCLFWSSKKTKKWWPVSNNNAWLDLRLDCGQH